MRHKCLPVRQLKDGQPHGQRRGASGDPDPYFVDVLRMLRRTIRRHIERHERVAALTTELVQEGPALSVRRLVNHVVRGLTRSPLSLTRKRMMLISLTALGFFDHGRYSFPWSHSGWILACLVVSGSFDSAC
jgi:hypothetical protein